MHPQYKTGKTNQVVIRLKLQPQVETATEARAKFEYFKLDQVASWKKYFKARWEEARDEAIQTFSIDRINIPIVFDEDEHIPLINADDYYHFDEKTNMIDLIFRFKPMSKNKIEQVLDNIDGYFGEVAADSWQEGNIDLFDEGSKFPLNDKRFFNISYVLQKDVIIETPPVKKAMKMKGESEIGKILKGTLKKAQTHYTNYTKKRTSKKLATAMLKEKKDEKKYLENCNTLFKLKDDPILYQQYLDMARERPLAELKNLCGNFAKLLLNKK